jgi:hypothetical protein
LFSLADVRVIGQLGDVQALGGVAIGAKLITTLLMLFNFLRSRNSEIGPSARFFARDRLAIDPIARVDDPALSGYGSVRTATDVTDRQRDGRDREVEGAKCSIRCNVGDADELRS